MKLLTAQIEEFGKLERRRFVFGDGITLIEGENESGKSTLLAFIRFALYGFPRRGGTDGEERERRLSFRNRRAAGSLSFSVDGREYCIFRSVTARNERDTAERLSVTEESDGKAVELGGKTPGEFFLGIPAELYDSSLCVRQSELDRVGEGDVSGKVGELLASTGGAERAGKLLESARRTLSHRRGRGGRIPALEDEEAELTKRIAAATESAVALAELSAREKNEADELAQYKAELAALNTAAEKASLTAAAEQYRELCHTEEEARGAALRVQELETQLAALPGDEALSGLGTLLGSVRESRQNFFRADATLRSFEPKLPPAEAVLTENTPGGEIPGNPYTNPATTPEHDDANGEIPGKPYTNPAPGQGGINGEIPGNPYANPALGQGGTGGEIPGKQPAPGRTAPKKEPARPMIWSWFFPVLFAIFTIATACAAIASMGETPDLALPFSPIYLWLAAGGFLLITLVCGIYGRLRHRRKPPRLTEAHSAAKEAYSRTLQNFLDTQNTLYTVWENTCGVPFVPTIDPEAVLREYAKERGGILSEISAKKEAQHRADEKAAYLRERVGDLNPDAVAQRLAELAALPLQTGNREELSAQRAMLNRQAEACEARLTATRQSLAARAAGATDPATLTRARAELRERLTTAKEELAALDLAEEALVAAQTELRRDIAPALCAAAGKIFGQLRRGISTPGEPCPENAESGGLHSLTPTPGEPYPENLDSGGLHSQAPTLGEPYPENAESGALYSQAPAHSEPCPENVESSGLHLGADFSMLLDAEGTRHPLACFSAGCRDAAYLSLRMALTDLLTREPMPFLFDEPAARLDDRRTAALLSLLVQLSKNGRQCLLFTCHHREAAMLTELAPFDRITL